MDKWSILKVVLAIPPCIVALFYLQEHFSRFGIDVPIQIIQLLVFASIASIGIVIAIKIFNYFNRTSPEILCNFASTKPMIDGRWSFEEEWTDTKEYVMRYGSAYFRTKHDDDFLYFILDVVSEETVHKGSFCWIYLDTEYDRSDLPNIDDFAFSLQWITEKSEQILMQKGQGNGWGSETTELPNGFLAASAVSKSKKKSLAHPHIVYEFRIPMTLIRQRKKIGFRIGIRNMSEYDPKKSEIEYFIIWPRLSQDTYPSRDNPESWGLLKIIS